ncbi:3-deoxy-D-manno-octulosonic acid transferase [Paracoccus sp. Z118]|uniref:3-deoxy-D-manno-octulosonic acid transferase n=1 Tax=Paracoccus sp. Z118 TaxID=2851017 RepID=UPI001C2BB0FD|nr:glycosyltransferase N-terminal domain-containing protein [Paracoccus sp. Z118]MBV0892934.1 3-deoxy-D-manno-octulosonic acid transferase [Paracoccus sp. Z118]
MLYRAATALAGGVMRAAGPLAGPVWRERMVLGATLPHPAGGIWIHGASVGELTSARRIVAALARERPVIVTANTITGRAVVRDWGLPARLAPLDVPGAVGRFMDRYRPAVMVTVENEIWPSRAAAARARGVGQVVVGARLSERSAARWAKARALIGPVLAGLDALSAQDEGSEARLVALGLPPAALMPRLQLKLLDPAATPAPPDSAARDATWLAASTHAGEDELVLDAFLSARAEVPGLRLILAPRHPQRGDAVAALIAARGLAVARRSAGDDLAAPVLLVDVLGEMGRWYDAAGICLTGGSLVDHGGHTPWEPAGHGCAILHGPHVGNAAADYAALDAAGAALRTEAGDLAVTVARLAADPAAARAMGRRARDLLHDKAGDPAPLVGRILALAAARSRA